MTTNRQTEQTLWRSPTLLGILALGAILRLWHLGVQSFWIDEGFSWLAIRLSFRGITALSWTDVHPPLYYYILKASQWVLPNNEFGLRVPSVVFSIATLAVMMAFVNRHWRVRAASCVGLLQAISPFDIYYAQEARMYALLALLFVLSFTQLAEALQGRPACLIGWVAASIGLAWTHVYGLLTVFVQIGFVLGYLVWHSRLRRWPLSGFKPQRLIAALVALVLGVLPVVILIWTIRTNRSGSVMIPDVRRLRTLLGFWSTGPMHAFPAFRIPWRTHDLSEVVMLGCACWGAHQLWKGEARWKWILSLATVLILAPPLLVYGVSSLKHQAIWIERGFLGCAHIIYFLAGIGLSAIGLRAVRGLAIAAIAISIVSGEMYYYTRFEKSEAAAAFHSLPPASRHRAVLVIPYWRNCEAHYYLGANAAIWTVQEDHPQQLERIRVGMDEMPEISAVKCDEPELQSASDLYAFGDATIIKSRWAKWPDCLHEKKIWVFEGGHWQPLDG